MTGGLIVRGNCGRQRAAILGVPLLIVALPFLAQADLLHTDAQVSTSLLGTSNQPGTSSSFVTLGNGIASAQAGFGTLKGLASAVGTGDGSSVDSTATSFFSDTVTILGLPTGTAGTMTVSVDVLGSMNYSGNCLPLITGAPACFAAWSLGVTDGGPTSIDLGGRIDNIKGSTGNGFGMQTATFSFTYGVAFDLSGGLTVEAYNDGLQASSISVDMAHSVYWGGISNVTANGLPVSSFTVISNSGTDWSQSFVPSTTPVPEPSAAVLMGSLLGALCLLQRRRRGVAGARTQKDHEVRPIQ